MTGHLLDDKDTTGHRLDDKDMTGHWLDDKDTTGHWLDKDTTGHWLDDKDITGHWLDKDTTGHWLDDKDLTGYWLDDKDMTDHWLDDKDMTGRGLYDKDVISSIIVRIFTTRFWVSEIHFPGGWSRQPWRDVEDSLSRRRLRTFLTLLPPVLGFKTLLTLTHTSQFSRRHAPWMWISCAFELVGHVATSSEFARPPSLLYTGTGIWL